MPRLELHRICYGPAATVGLLRWGGELLYTLEDPWRANAVGVSCIPDGVYRCRPRRFHRGGYDAVEITGVPGRSQILIHRGNTADDVTGCILVGAQLGDLRGRIAVLDSAGAWSRFFPAWGRVEFELAIAPIFPLATRRLQPAVQEA